MSSITNIAGAFASSYAIAQTPATTKPQVQAAAQNTPSVQANAGSDADGDGDHDGGGIDISG